MEGFVFTTARTRVLVGRAAAHRSYMVHGRKACMQASRAPLGKFACFVSMHKGDMGTRQKRRPDQLEPPGEGTRRRNHCLLVEIEPIVIALLGDLLESFIKVTWQHNVAVFAHSL